MLKEQYRMHPAICELVSNQFYKGELVTGDHVKAMRLRVPAGGITWQDYPEIQAESTDRLRMCNMVEVDLLGAFMCDELPALLSRGKSVAVITFYKQQFLELIKMGEACGTVKTREEMKKSGDSGSRFTHPNFRIVTVDAAQGSEADVILLSCVRCNRQRNIGFIKDKNRLCVALSRARERLIVVGSRATLAVDPVWRAVMASAATH
jgi:superfamily I DNA and/or RNA helicase